MSRRRAVFLDRDGTLIEGEGYLGDPTGVRAIPGVAEALEIIESKGWLRVVVTNQSGVARGLFTEDDYAAVEEAVTEAVGEVDGSYACFHLPTGTVERWSGECDCRKPMPGMILQAAAELRIDLDGSVLAGDDLRDLEAARSAGVEPVLVRTGKGATTEAAVRGTSLGGVRVVDDVLQLARQLPDVGDEG